MTLNKISENEIHKTAELPQKKEGFSFYQRLFFLYFLNIVDWICTEALLNSGKFFEANPLMQAVIGNFWGTVLIKGALPLVLVLMCAVVFKFSGGEENFTANLLLYVGITVYSLVNLLHIFNFLLLFSGF